MINKLLAINIDFLGSGYHKVDSRVAGDPATVSAQMLVTNVINAMLLIAGIMAVIYLVYSGITYITAAGNADAVKKGQTGLLYGAIGVAVVVISYFVVRAVSSFATSEFGNT